MPFHKSSKLIEVSNGNLTASCRDLAGREVRSELHLDQHLGNANGFFKWGGKDFSRSATNVYLQEDGEFMYLHARLRTHRNTWREARVNLSAKISNHNGVLKYVGGQEPFIEYGTESVFEFGRDFIEEHRDFLSEAISETMQNLRETIFDLRELFSGIQIFDASRPTETRREGLVPSQYSSTASHEQSVADEAADVESRGDEKENLTTSDGSSVTDEKEDPPAYDLTHDKEDGQDKVEAESPTPLARSVIEEKTKTSSNASDTNDVEEIAMQHVKDFLLGGEGNTVRTLMSNGRRIFELRDNAGFVRTLRVEEKGLVVEDGSRRGSVSEASDRCATPSFVDGEEEYDFLD